MNVGSNKCFPMWYVVANIITIIVLLFDMGWSMTDIPEPVYLKKIADVAFWGLIFLLGYECGMRNRFKCDRLK